MGEVQGQSLALALKQIESLRNQLVKAEEGKSEAEKFTKGLNELVRAGSVIGQGGIDAFVSDFNDGVYALEKDKAELVEVLRGIRGLINAPDAPCIFSKMVYVSLFKAIEELLGREPNDKEWNEVFDVFGEQERGWKACRIEEFLRLSELDKALEKHEGSTGK